MTTAALLPSNTYIEDGITLKFAAPFRYLTPADLTVDRIEASGTTKRLKLGTDYTATAGSTDAGGTLTLLSTVAGAKLRIRRTTPRTQSTQYTTSDTFPAKSHEAALDRAMLIDQEQDVKIADTVLRAYLVPDGETGGTMPAAAARAGKFQAFDAFGKPIASSGTGADSGLRTDLVAVGGGALVSGYSKIPASPKTDYGAAGDGMVADDISVAATLAEKKAVLIDASYQIAATKDVAHDQSLQGLAKQGTIKINAAAGLTFATALRLNLNTAETTWVQAYPNLPGMVISDFNLDASTAQAAGDKVTGISFGGSPIFRNMQFRGVVTAIKQGGNAATLYCDKITIDHVDVEAPAEQTSGEYLFDLSRGLGDACFLNQLDHIAVLADAGGGLRKPANGVKLGNRMSGVMQNIINGGHLIANSRGMDLNSFHIENGGLELQDSVASLRNMLLWQRGDTATQVGYKRIPLRFTTASSGVNAGLYAVDNIAFVYWPQFTGSYPTDNYNLEVQSGARLTVQIRNIARWIASDTGSVSDATYLGVNAWDGTNPLTAFNAYSHFASLDSRITNGRVYFNAARPSLGATSGLTALALSPKRTWAGATGTLYVRALYYYDTYRCAGVTGSGELSLALVNGANGARIQINPPPDSNGTPVPGLMCRLYFGMPGTGGTGSYDAYVDVPVITGQQLYFNGSDVGGYPIIARAAAAADAINTHLTGGFAIAAGDNGANAYGVATMQTTSTTALFPSVGSFRAGDTITGPNASARFDGAAWQIVSGRAYTNADMGDAALNISAQRTNGGVIASVTALTADRILTLPAPANVAGAQPFTVSRTGGGAFNLNVSDGTSTIQAIVSGQSFAFFPTSTGYVIARLR